MPSRTRVDAGTRASALCADALTLSLRMTRDSGSRHGGIQGQNCVVRGQFFLRAGYYDSTEWGCDVCFLQFYV